MDKLKIGLIGLGTVGSGVFKSLAKFDNIEIVKIAVRNINKPRSVEVPTEILTDNPYDVVNHPEINVVVELCMRYYRSITCMLSRFSCVRL